jgi:hypothetical protein
MSEINRDQLVQEYIDRVLDNMTTKDLMRIVGDQLEENLLLTPMKNLSLK